MKVPNGRRTKKRDASSNRIIIIMTRRQLRSVATTLHDVHVHLHSATSVSSWTVFRCRSAVYWGRPGGLLQFIPRFWPPFIAVTWHNAWCAGVVASSLRTWPNSAWRLLLIISAMFGRPVLSAMSTFFTWSCHFTPSIWRWQDIWKDKD